MANIIKKENDMVDGEILVQGKEWGMWENIKGWQNKDKEYDTSENSWLVAVDIEEFEETVLKELGISVRWCLEEMTVYMDGDYNDDIDIKELEEIRKATKFE